MPKRPDTARMPGNQPRIDELEFFIEGLGGHLFGHRGEDFRHLRQHVPRTRNLSALIDLYRDHADRDVAEDLRFLLEEVELKLRVATSATPPVRERAAVFDYRRYLGLLDHPERLLDQVPVEQRFEVASALARGIEYLGPLLAKTNAYAWLVVVGLPDLELELASGSAARIRQRPYAPAEEQLERILDACKPPLGQGMRAYLQGVLGALRDDYAEQLAGFAHAGDPLP